MSVLSPSPTASPAIEVEHLVKTFRRHRATEFRAVDDLSFTVARGSIFGLLGPNGAGKTTTLRILTTRLQPTEGRARVHGHDVVSDSLNVRRSIAVVIQEVAVDLLLSVRDNLVTFANFYGLERATIPKRVDRVLDQFELRDEASSKVMDLSGGFRRRVQVAKVFLVDTPVLFLDEFSTGMDPILKRSIMASLRAEVRRGRTVVLTTQILSEAEELCDDILIVDKGRQVARGDVHALKMLSHGVYQVSLTFDRVPDGIEPQLAAREPLRLRVTDTTIEIALKENEQQVLALVSELARRGHLLRIEIGGASLEDVFVDLLQPQPTRSEP
jgi:ABC-2 type transport system ATP-binding protein